MELYLAYAENNEIDIEGLTDSQIRTKIEDIAGNKYLEEYYNKGETLKIDACDECDTYSYGDYRCSCGNVRISMTVEGSLAEGYYSYPEGC